jgi:hypothetical protein
MTNNNLPIVLCTALCTSVATYAVLDIVLPRITIDIKINRNFFSLVGGVVAGIGSLKYFCK